MSKDNTLLLRAAKILKANGKADTVYFTSDGSPFLREVDANNHARTLDDKTVTPIGTADVSAEPANQEDKGGNNTPDAKPLNKMNVEELKAEIAKREGLTVDDKATKKQMVEAIEKYDADKAAAPGEPAKVEADVVEEGNQADGNKADAPKAE